MSDELDEGFAEVLESAARLQELVPDAVLVGGSAAAFYARHRLSYDHDHVVQSLHDRFDVVFDALDREGDFVLARAIPQKIILGELGGIEVGIRQLIRKRPLEVQQIELPSGKKLTIPTEAETVRIKSYLIVKRNQVRDYLDVAAMSSRYGAPSVAEWISGIDDYYTDDTAPPGSSPVLTQLMRQLLDPQPRDSRTLKDLGGYKGLASRWSDWDRVREECREITAEILGNS
ncbi:hypothetical protein G7068_10025 [Leucobacter viscericola]|uniref:Nucleotidyl transferase AbiEii toxin, Type IV TA system n=1 Tax=Leucobacter viscericola TaxID=2714935 RepID=A0A6G7XGC9_9MICO|nr:hypothetical protein [Leucobacter viscericola]QIK63499.1 hypothetical protein G7068_10025 [Leucobacter viscericola]